MDSNIMSEFLDGAVSFLGYVATLVVGIVLGIAIAMVLKI